MLRGQADREQGASEMSFEGADEPKRNLFVSVLLGPRKTIEHIVATQPTRGVLALAVLGGAAAGICQLYSFHSFVSPLSDWLTGVLALGGGAILGVLNLYVVAFFIALIARLLRGRASNQDVRAAFAWGQLPLVVGTIVAFAILGAGHLAGNELVLVLSTVAFGLVLGIGGAWSFISTLLMIARVEKFGFWRAIVAYVVGVAVPVPLALALSIRTFLYQPFNIPAGSMAPTLLVGDYFFANKFAYGYSRLSLPFAPPLFSGRFFAADPRPGDVVVFVSPKNPSTFVKRVVGVAGDRVQMKEGQLLINGTPVKRERLSGVVGDFCGAPPVTIRRWRETLPNGMSYETLDCVDNGFYDNTPEYVVPPGYAFVMGDNRDNSTDSRIMAAMGYIPLDNIFGRAAIIFYSRGEDGVGRNERIGTTVR